MLSRRKKLCNGGKEGATDKESKAKEERKEKVVGSKAEATTKKKLEEE